MNGWIPRFKVNDCIKFGRYNNICIEKVDIEGKTYKFKNGTSFWGPNIDNGFEYENNVINPAELIIGGKRKTHRNLKSKKSKKNQKNKKTNRRRRRK